MTIDRLLSIIRTASAVVVAAVASFAAIKIHDVHHQVAEMNRRARYVITGGWPITMHDTTAGETYRWQSGGWVKIKASE